MRFDVSEAGNIKTETFWVTASASFAGGSTFSNNTVPLISLTIKAKATISPNYKVVQI